MAEYEDGPITHVEEKDHGKRLIDQIKDYLNNTPKEQLERDFFEIRCKCEGIFLRSEGIDPQRRECKT